MTPPLPQQAIILAAGFGTRLRPLTHRVPKPALPLGGVPVLYFNLLLLKEAGVRDIVINLYHQGKILKNLLPPSLGKKLGIKIHFSLEKKILGTAGGIVQALRKLEERQTCWILNGDVISDISLKKMAKQHFQGKSQATLAVVPKNRVQVKSHLYYDSKNRLWKIGKKPNFQNARSHFKAGIFSGIHLVDPQIFQHYPRNKFGCVMQEIYLPLLKEWQSNPQQSAPLQVFPHSGAWWDVGSLAQLTALDRQLWSEKAPESISKLWKKARAMT